jgi:hypothetical protein
MADFPFNGMVRTFSALSSSNEVVINSRIWSASQAVRALEMGVSFKFPAFICHPSMRGLQRGFVE